MRAQRGDAVTCPTVAMTRDEAIPLENASDDIIIGDQHELANSGNHIGCGAVVLTAAASGQTHLAMDATDPVDHESDLRHHVADGHRDRPHFHVVGGERTQKRGALSFDDKTEDFVGGMA